MIVSSPDWLAIPGGRRELESTATGTAAWQYAGYVAVRRPAAQAAMRRWLRLQRMGSEGGNGGILGHTADWWPSGTQLASARGNGVQARSGLRPMERRLAGPKHRMVDC